MSKNVFFRMKNAVSFSFFNYTDTLEVFVFFVSRKMMLVPSLMCILIPLSTLLCSGKFDTVSKLFFFKFLIVKHA